MKAATAAGAGSAGVLTPFVIWLVGQLFFAGGEVPLPLVGVIGLVVTGLCTFIGGWLARHSPRAASIVRPRSGEDGTAAEPAADRPATDPLAAD
ncbi:hypothetical protein CIK06_19875 [Plantactinospora sp. KBS50]|nr:hypothetical protein CIK06_19875 [Plantactinospora sp. KBS50]